MGGRYTVVVVFLAAPETDADEGYKQECANGYEVSFNADGEWTDVDAPAGQSIPDGIAPQAITDYIAANYNGAGINDISLDSRGYEVELVSGVDLLFAPDGSFLGVDR